MKDGSRTIIFKHLLKNIPAGTNKMCCNHSEAQDAIEKMFVEQYTDDAIERTMSVFTTYGYNENGDYETRRYESLDKLVEACSCVFKTKEKAIKWGAESCASREYMEALNWLLENGYVREWKKPARFGFYHYIGITPKGWKVAHLYK